MWLCMKKVLKNMEFKFALNEANSVLQSTSNNYNLFEKKSLKTWESSLKKLEKGV